MPNRALVLFGLAVILIGVNLSIFSKETQLAEGEAIFMELAPVDPRSLMQGDYMALNYAVSQSVREAMWAREGRTETYQVPDNQDGLVVVRRDARGVGEFVRLDDGTPLADDERRLKFRFRDGMVKLATNAFFFQEGTGELYVPARYGAFRVSEQGELLLVALHDEQLQPLGSKASGAKE